MYVFVPFLGDFFQSGGKEFPIDGGESKKFSSPLSGTFFNPLNAKMDTIMAALVFVPFIGDFFQSRSAQAEIDALNASFRPLYRGLFSIFMGNIERSISAGVFVPFIGDFFQSNETTTMVVIPLDVFVPFIGDFFQSFAKSRKKMGLLCFRPLYRGLFSIYGWVASKVSY